MRISIIADVSATEIKVETRAMICVINGRTKAEILASGQSRQPRINDDTARSIEREGIIVRSVIVTKKKRKEKKRTPVLIHRGSSFNPVRVNFFIDRRGENCETEQAEWAEESLRQPYRRDANRSMSK